MKKADKTLPKRIKKENKVVPVHKLVAAKPEVKQPGARPISATGKRKTAVAVVKLNIRGTGQILANGKKIEEYFPFFEWQNIVEQPLYLTNLRNKLNLSFTLTGGGLKAQAEAARLAVAKALVQMDPDYRAILKPQGFLTRDARVKERKKPGLKRARKAPQWAKR